MVLISLGSKEKLKGFFDPVTLNLYAICNQSTMVCNFWGSWHSSGKN